jgi:hypothetical protein
MTIKRDNLDKLYIKCVNLLIAKLWKLRYKLLLKLQTDIHVYSKLILVYKDIPNL